MSSLKHVLLMLTKMVTAQQHLMNSLGVITRFKQFLTVWTAHQDHHHHSTCEYHPSAVRPKHQKKKGVFHVLNPQMLQEVILSRRASFWICCSGKNQPKSSMKKMRTSLWRHSCQVVVIIVQRCYS